MSNGTTTWTYTYDSDGLRTGRTNGTTTYTYVYSGSQLSWMTVGDTELQFTYDANGRPLAVVYNGTVYYYALNLQGDVVAILNSSGSAVVYYTYDAWGNILSSSGSMDTTLGLHNPLRYRGYVYDSETGLYYLQSRYYNPDWGRFINADVFISTGQGQLGNNMFAYCNNNPANRIDITGMFWSEIWNAIGSWASNIFGAGLTSTATLFKTEASIVPDPSPITITTGAETKAVARKQGDSSKFISLYAEEDLTNPSLSSGGIYLNIDKFTLDISFGLDNLGVSGNITNKGTTASFGAKADISKFKIGFEHSTTTVTDTRIHESYTNVSVSGLWIVALYAFVTTGQVYAVNGP